MQAPIVVPNRYKLVPRSNWISASYAQVVHAPTSRNKNGKK